MWRSEKLKQDRDIRPPCPLTDKLQSWRRWGPQLKEHFKYELAAYQMALFTEEGMRKGTKSKFYSAFFLLPQNISVEAITFVVVYGM